MLMGDRFSRVPTGTIHCSGIVAARDVGKDEE